MTSRSSSPGPLSLRAVRDDDALLDEIAERRTGQQFAAEQVVVLLSALAADVDQALPTGVDRLATQALAAALAAHERPRRPASTACAASVLPVRSTHPHRSSRQLVRVRRGTAVMVAAACVLGSAGVAAAVTGSVPDAFSVNGIVRLLTGAPDPTPTATNGDLAQRKARSELTRRLKDQVSRPAGADAAELARLLRVAATLPDHGGPDVRALLQRLRAKQAAAAAASQATASPARERPTPAPPAAGVASGRGTPVGPAATPSGSRSTRPSTAAPTAKAPRAHMRVGGRTTSADPKAPTARR